MENLRKNKKPRFIDNRYIRINIFVILLTYVLIFNGMINVKAAEVIKNSGVGFSHICLGRNNAEHSYGYCFQSDDVNMCVGGHNFCGELGIVDINSKGSKVQARESNVISKYRTIFNIKRDIAAWSTGYKCFGKCGIDKKCHCRPIPTMITKLTQLQKATNAVVKAETSKKQIDESMAQNLVNDLLASTDKTNLNNRLINLRNSINLAIAEDAVLKVGESLKQIDLEHAKLLVDEVLSPTDKASMLNQLVIFQTFIDRNNATILVIKAEESKQQIDVARAKDLVNTLSDSTDVTSLIHRLAKVQNDIDLTKAVNAVINAETSKQQIDIIIATSLVNALPNSTGKTDLASRLAIVQKNINKEMSLTNIISTVVKAEESKTQEDVDKAMNLVNALPDLTEKTSLLNRLVVVQNSIDLTNAENAVNKAEISKQQVDVDKATSLVNALTASTYKTDLSNRLGAVQRNINEQINLTNAKCAVVRAEETKRQEDIDLAMRLVDDLPDPVEKTSLLNRLTSVQNEINKLMDLTNAISAVVNAEISKQQKDVDKAINLVKTLSDSIDKTNLLDRLAIVQNSIDLTNATNVVVKAEETKQQVYVSIAKSLVNTLPDSAEKTSLSNRLSSVQNEINKSTDLANAINSVVNAETTKQQIDVNKAISLVEVLSDSTERTNLLARLVVLQNNIDLTNAANMVVKAEASKQQVDVDRAKSLVNTLPDSTEKTSLINRLASVQEYIDKSIDVTNATNAVDKAETTKQQIDVDKAKSLVTALLDSVEKTNLLDRLVIVQNNIDLINETNAVIKAEESKQQVDVDKAKSLVNTLPDSTEKTSLINRLASVQEYIDRSIDLTNATNAVDKAETTKQQIDVDKAKSLVTALVDSAEKTNLLDRLVIVQNDIDLINETNAVIKAEESKQQVDVDKAKSLVNTLPDSTEKTSLINRLASVQEYIDRLIDLTNATNAVDKAETTKQQIDVDKAKSLVTALLDSVEKTNLLDRLVIVQNNIDLTNATNMVVKAEESKQQSYLDRSMSLVNVLSDSVEKTSLLNRLANVENEINRSINLTNAISAVVNAETNKQQIDVDKAISLVKVLSDSTEKTNLLDRLVVVQEYIDLINATDAVIKAEGSKAQADVNKAISLVNALSDSTEKIELINRLAKVQSSIDYTISLDNAVKAVIRAEASKLQWDVDRATNLVNALLDSTDKTNLLDRLAVVQSIMDDPVIAVEKAETTKLQADVDRAKNLVSHIQNAEDKLKLQNRVTTVQDIIDLNNATNAVIIAEDNKVQLYVDNASTLVNNLKDSTEKINFIKRLTIVQEEINFNNVQISVTNAEASLQQADVDMARNLAAALPNSIEKINLLNRLVNVQNSINLANARIAVNIAEGSKLQADLDTATNSVNILPNTINKTSLLSRVVTLKNTVDLVNATNAVSKAEATKVQTDVDTAKALVIALSDSTTRTNLVDRLTTLQASIDLTNAINAVSKVEATKIQADADVAKVLVTALPSSTTRTNLLNRLVVIQNDISLTSAINGVSKAEATKAQADIDTAKSLVNVLPVSTLRTNLLDRLAVLQRDVDLNNAINAVAKVEATKQQADLDIAKGLVNMLPASTTRTTFLDRLAIVESEINLTAATNAVSKAEVTKTQADVDTAKTLLITLPTSTIRTELLDRLAVVQSDITLTNAVNAVLKVEATKTQADLDIAKTLVNVLPNPTIRTNLLDRLAVVQSNINLTNAANAVSKAEATKQQVDVDAAKSLVIALPTSTDRATLLNRLINVQNMVDINNSTNAVTKSEGSKLQADVDAAMILVNALPNSATKTNLLSRLATVQYNINLINATNAVAKAESTKVQTDIDLAQSYINKLPLNDTNRVQLQQRLNIAKA